MLAPETRPIKTIQADVAEDELLIEGCDSSGIHSGTYYITRDMLDRASGNATRGTVRDWVVKVFGDHFRADDFSNA